MQLSLIELSFELCGDMENFMGIGPHPHNWCKLVRQNIHSGPKKQKLIEICLLALPCKL